MAGSGALRLAQGMGRAGPGEWSCVCRPENCRPVRGPHRPALIRKISTWSAKRWWRPRAAAGSLTNFRPGCAGRKTRTSRTACGGWKRPSPPTMTRSCPALPRCWRVAKSRSLHRSAPSPKPGWRPVTW